jgi:hypothetical protein
VLTALFKDLALPLDGRQQESIALWSLKTVMVLEALRPKDQAWFYDPSERHALRKSKQLPPHTAVWLGRYQGRSPLTSHGAAFGPIAGDFHATWGFVATLTLGALVIEVRSLRSDYKLTPHPGPWNHSLRQVWPRVEGVVRWPPRLAFTDEGGTLPLPRLIRRWANIRGANPS